MRPTQVPCQSRASEPEMARCVLDTALWCGMVRSDGTPRGKSPNSVLTARAYFGRGDGPTETHEDIPPVWHPTPADMHAACPVHEITSQHVDTMLDFFEETTHHASRHWLHKRWAEAWAGRGGTHVLPAIAAPADGPHEAQLLSGTAVTARRLWN